jgi:DNA-binding MarR family transcriptional regulator
MADDFDIAGIDEVIHGRVRLGIMAYLAGAGGAEFNDIKARLAVTDGNLSIHLKKLEEAGYVAIDKRFRDKKPVTTVAITVPGRRAFATYLDAIGKLVDQAGGGTS